MGYSGLDHVSNSDSASDAASDVMDAMVKEMRKALKERANSVNTNGVVNVALMFCDMIIPCQQKKYGDPYSCHDSLVTLAETVVKKLDARIKRESKNDWGSDAKDKESKSMHLRAYRRMRRQIQGFIEGSDV